MLTTDFFQRNVLTVARDLIGVELFWKGCSGIIVETEAYAVEHDEACHTATRPTTREFVKTHPAGTAYVYLNYGMYWLFNLLVKGGPKDGLILIRALEPFRGVEEMKRRRGKEKVGDLCSGPGKLTLALGITGEHHGVSMTGKGRPADCGMRFPEETGQHVVVEDIRVGISKATDFPWRFLAQEHPHVSVAYGRVKIPQPRLGGRKKPPIQKETTVRKKR